MIDRIVILGQHERNFHRNWSAAVRCVASVTEVMALPSILGNSNFNRYFTLYDRARNTTSPSVLEFIEAYLIGQDDA